MTATSTEAPQGASFSAVELTYHLGTLVALTASAKLHGGFAMPVVYQAGTDRQVIIDGHHRTKVAADLAANGFCITVEHKEVETDNPNQLRVDLNRCRRPWNDEEERRTQVQALRAAGFSSRQAAKVLGVGMTTVKRDLKPGNPTAPNEAVGFSQPETSAAPPIARSAKKPPAGPEEIATAWALKAQGLSSKTIAKQLGRNVNTLTAWFKKAPPEAVPAPVATPAPEPVPAPEPEAPKRHESYKIELKYIETIIEIGKDLADLEVRLTRLNRRRNGDAIGRLSMKDNSHQAVVYYIEQYEPEVLARLMQNATAPYNTTIVDHVQDIDRIVRRVSAGVGGFAAAHGYLSTHGQPAVYENIRLSGG